MMYRLKKKIIKKNDVFIKMLYVMFRYMYFHSPSSIYQAGG